MKKIEDIFAVNRIVPVVVINDINAAIPLAETLLSSGINTMEITLRTENARKIIEKVAKEVPQMLVGAGTIRTAADYVDACNAGAEYIISPGVTNELLNAASRGPKHVRYIPGVVTPSQVMDCADHDIKYLKFFPAEPYNAYEVIKSLSSVFPDVKFCPTGGISNANVGKYVQLANIFAAGMSSIVEAKLIAAHDFAEIKRRCDESVAIVKQILNLA